jgi:leukocyte immunoglobulin-like receptor
VSIWCQGTLETQEYHLYKEGSQEPWDTKTSVESGNEAIPFMTEHHEGQYRCHYFNLNMSSEHSEPLELVVTGEGACIGINPRLRKRDDFLGCPLS